VLVREKMAAHAGEGRPSWHFSECVSDFIRWTNHLGTLPLVLPGPFSAERAEAAWKAFVAESAD
jgi:hypothetical protein